jgi:hypothetical protein
VSGEAVDGPAVVERVWPGVVKDQDDDLSEVLRNVRVNRMPATRRTWANSWQTRAFLHLALRVMFENQLADATKASYGPPIWGVLRPDRLAGRARELFQDDATLDGLSTERWRETWGHREAFVEDLIAYLFRPGPSVTRLEGLRGWVIAPDGVPFSGFMAGLTVAEYQAVSANPLYGLQLWLTAAMPTHRAVALHARALESSTRPIRAELYQRIYSRYDLRPQGVTWGDVADVYAMVLRGMYLRGRMQGEAPLMEDGEPTLVASLLGLTCGWFGITRAELDRRLPVEGWALLT